VLHGSSKHATQETFAISGRIEEPDLINAQLPIADPDVTAHRWRVFGRREVQILYARIQFVCSRKRTIVLGGFVIQPRVA
jgi:hypothetical protein